MKAGAQGTGVFNVDIFAGERRRRGNSRRTRCLLRRSAASFSLAAGETLVADVVIQNKGIGHTHVPEQRSFYEVLIQPWSRTTRARPSPKADSFNPTARSTLKRTHSPTG